MPIDEQFFRNLCDKFQREYHSQPVDPRWLQVGDLYSLSMITVSLLASTNSSPLTDPFPIAGRKIPPSSLRPLLLEWIQKNHQLSSSSSKEETSRVQPVGWLAWLEGIIASPLDVSMEQIEYFSLPSSSRSNSSSSSSHTPKREPERKRRLFDSDSDSVAEEEEDGSVQEKRSPKLWMRHQQKEKEEERQKTKDIGYVDEQ